MKKLNVLWLFALLLALPMGFTSCSDDDGPGSSSDFVGTWEETYEKWICKEDGEVVEEGEDRDLSDYRMRLNADGTVDFGDYWNSQWHWESNAAEWWYKNGKLYIKVTEGGEEEIGWAKVVELSATKLAVETTDSYKENGIAYEDYEYQEYKKVADE